MILIVSLSFGGFACFPHHRLTSILVSGQVLTRDNIEAVVKFAHREKLMIFADEVR